MVPFLLKFVDNLANVYVRFNRKRLKGRTGEDDSSPFHLQRLRAEDYCWLSQLY
jgi:hypothetical protein